MKIFERMALPNFYKVLETKHYIKGRIRLKVEKLKGINKKFKDEVINILIQIDGVESVKIEELTGSITIVFREEKVPVEMIVGIVIKVLSLEEDIEGKKEGVVDEKIRGFFEILDHSIYNKSKGMLTFKSSLFLIFTALGVTQIRKRMILPNGVNLLWWALNTTKGGK